MKTILPLDVTNRTDDLTTITFDQLFEKFNWHRPIQIIANTLTVKIICFSGSLMYHVRKRKNIEFSIGKIHIICPENNSEVNNVIAFFSTDFLSFRAKITDFEQLNSLINGLR